MVTIPLLKTELENLIKERILIDKKIEAVRQTIRAFREHVHAPQWETMLDEIIASFHKEHNNPEQPVSQSLDESI